MRSLALVTTSAGVVFVGLNIVRGNEKFYSDYLMPAARMIPPETAHNLSVLACKHKLFPSAKEEDSSILVANAFTFLVIVYTFAFRKQLSLIKY